MNIQKLTGSPEKGSNGSGKGAMTERWIFISRPTGSYPPELSAIASGEFFVPRDVKKGHSW